MGESVCHSIWLRECCVYGSQSKTDRAVTDLMDQHGFTS